MNGTAGVLGVGARLGMDVWIGAVTPSPGRRDTLLGSWPAGYFADEPSVVLTAAAENAAWLAALNEMASSPPAS